MGFVEELEWRGMIHDIIPGTKELFNKQENPKDSVIIDHKIKNYIDIK